jgi:anaerobic selenocysteine-containing dehydrogenase
MSDKELKPTQSGISRRDFLKTSAFVGGSLAVAMNVENAFQRVAGFSQTMHGASASSGYPLNDAENLIYSVCLQCHTACTIKAKVLDGVLVKIDGNPYSPMNLLPQLAYDTPAAQAAKVDAKLCPKGQAGVNSQYDPYRITKVLKRVGKRGENKWQVVSFDQAINEIVNGGSFADGSTTPGLKGIWAVQDPELMAAIKTDASAVASGEMSLDEFKTKHADHLDLLIDPEHPDLGPKNNQFVFQAGRIEHGRKELAKRWLKDAFGSVNWFEHTSICEQSHHIATIQVTNQYGGKGSWSGGKEQLKPDFANAEMVIFFGTGAFEANFGPTPMSEMVTWSLTERNMKIAVVDPRLSTTASKAKWWLPVKPGQDGALALAMGRWILENERYDAAYLSNANKAAASAAGETSWSNATWLVKIENGQPTRLLRPVEAGLEDVDGFVVSQGGQLLAVDPNDAENPVTADLFVEGSVNGLSYKSTLQLYKEETLAHSLEEWSQLSGIPVRKIEEVSQEFTSHGKRVGVDFYRGPVQHTNGYYNGHAILMLNVLVGAAGWTGGMGAGGGGWKEDGSKTGQPFTLSQLHPGKLGSFGVTLTREGFKYEKTTLFPRDGYPAKRPWFPYTGSVYQEIIPSAADGYPYRIQALFLHKGTPGFSAPAGNPTLAAIADPNVIPLVFADDVVIGETSMFADYLFPDTSIWERWGTPHMTPAIQVKSSKMRQPIIEPLVEKVTVFGMEQPVSMEAVMLAISEKLGLSGFGKSGFGEGMDFNTREDYFLKMAANLAFGDKEDGSDALPEASDEELNLFRQARRHLSPVIFDEQSWKASLGGDESLWRKVVTLLNHGGRFEDFSKVYKGEKLAHPFSGLFNIFVDNVAAGKHSLTGKSFSGLPLYEETKDASGQPINPDAGAFPFQLFTYKHVYGGQSRTIGNYWAQLGVSSENYVLMNQVDADKLGLKGGDLVKLVSPTNPDGLWLLPNGEKKPVSGKVKPIQGIRPGTVAASWHFGHWAYGASDVVVDDQVVKGDARRATGICPNAVMLQDSVLKNVCLTDPIGGSASFYDTWINVVRA